MTIGNQMTKLLAPVCDAIDELLYGRELAKIRWHQAEIDRINRQAAERPAPDDDGPAGGQS